jgi:hypothetical protein
MRGAMPDLPGAPEYPLEIDSVECSPLGREKVVVRLTGAWRGRRRAADERALLVVEVDGRRHRFPAIPEPSRPRIGRPVFWAASFALPAWLEPRLGGQMSLLLGNVAIPLPPVSFAEGRQDDPLSRPEREQASDGSPRDRSAPAPERPEADPGSEVAARIEQLQIGLDEAHNEAERLRGLLVQRDRSSEAAAAGDPALAETVSALRGELQQRAESEARIRGELAKAQAELEARAVAHARVEATHVELRAELDQLRTLVEQESAQRAGVESKAVVLAAEVAEVQQQLDDLRKAREQALAARERLESRERELITQIGELRGQLAEIVVARDAAKGEAAALRAELDRLGAELAAAQADSQAREAGVVEAETLLADARALSARMLGRRARSDTEPAESS